MDEEIIMKVFQLAVKFWIAANITCGIPQAQYPRIEEGTASRFDFVCAAEIEGEKWAGYGTFYKVIEPKGEGAYLPYVEGDYQ